MIIVLYILGFLITVTIHEYAHARVAYFFGDKTAYLNGRLSLNPLRHIDIFWTIILPLFLYFMHLPIIGIAKPVPVNFAALKNPKNNMVWVALAGPIANLLMASILSLCFNLFNFEFLLLFIYFNVGLAVFNLLPILPLDGGRIVVGLLPRKYSYKFALTESYGIFIIIFLLYFGLLAKIVLPILNYICYLLRIPLF